MAVRNHVIRIGKKISFVRIFQDSFFFFSRSIGVTMDLVVLMPMVNPIVSVDKVTVVDDVNFDMIEVIMVIYTIILVRNGRKGKIV